MDLYLSNVVTNSELSFIKGGAFNIITAPRGWGKTTFMFDDRILNFAREKKHILYLVHTTALRDEIAAQHADKAIVFTDADSSSWFVNRKPGYWAEEDNENLIHVMCYQTFAALLRNEGTEWLNDIDLIIWDEFDDIKNYYEKEIKQLKKMLPNFSRERLVALLQEGRTNSVVNFVYQIKTQVLDGGRIKLIAISASPEEAALYFRDYINYILKGKLEEKYAAEETIYINNVIQALEDGTLMRGRKYWCYTTYIHNAWQIETVAKRIGFRPIVLWSEKNISWKDYYTEERRQALNYILNMQKMPEGYDFIIITSIGNRGLNIYDLDIQDWICDSAEYADIKQFIRARFVPARQYLLEKSRGIVDFIQDGIAIDYYNWHTLEELRQLIKEKPIFSNKDMEHKKLQTFNAVRKEYPDLFESRKYGKNRITQYRIKPTN